MEEGGLHNRVDTNSKAYVPCHFIRVQGIERQVFFDDGFLNRAGESAPNFFRAEWTVEQERSPFPG